MTLGFLLVGHGTRNSRGQAEFLQLVERVREFTGDTPLEAALLELAEPTIDEAMGKLRTLGVTEVRCAPVILLAAAHVKRDIPEAVRQAAEQHGVKQLTFVQHLGCHQTMLELSLKRYHAAVKGIAPIGSIGWVLVGRGTHDQEALAEIQRFQQLREQLETSSQHWLGFLAMAQPTLAEVLEQAAHSDAETIVVQPHLLFQGDLLTRTTDLTGEFAAKYVQKQWVLAEHLGPDAFLAQMLATELASRGNDLA